MPIVLPGLPHPIRLGLAGGPLIVALILGRVGRIGEKEPIDVEIIRYSLKVKGESTHITIEEATSSRQWLTVALREFIVGQDFAVPAKAVALLQLLT
jgi:hypothetical protein